MNSRLHKKVIFKPKKPDTKIVTLKLRRLQKVKLDELTKHSYFRVWITDETFGNIVNTIQLWREDKNKPKLKDFICIKESKHLGYTVIFQTMTQQKISIFKHHFGTDYVEAAEDLKGIRGLDVFELDLDRNVDDFFRPQQKGPQCMSDEVLEQLHTNWNEDQNENQDNQDDNLDQENNHNLASLNLPDFSHYNAGNMLDDTRSESLDRVLDTQWNIRDELDL